MTIILTLVGAALLSFAFKKKWEYDSYWKGRHEGWMACEHMVLGRAKDCGYENAYEDLVQ